MGGLLFKLLVSILDQTEQAAEGPLNSRGLTVHQQERLVGPHGRRVLTCATGPELQRVPPRNGADSPVCELNGLPNVGSGLLAGCLCFGHNSRLFQNCRG